MDPFTFSADSLVAPARLAFSITPNNSVDLAQTAKALYVGSGGDIILRAVGSEVDVTLRNVVAGSILPIRVQAVRQTGTTAADIVGLA